MKNLLKTVAVAFAFVISTTSFAQDKKANNIDDSKIGLQGYSPVSYLDLELAQRGSKQYKSVYEKVAYYFTSEEQKKTFENNPEKYLPQYGGFCAFGVYAGAKFRIDPNKFVVSDGKYYLFLNDVEVDAKQLWVSEKESKLLKKADKNWKSLSTK
ncbi:YHS domain-containing (seleno)protein [Aquimarina sp. 2201CG5-10]|uniref:YHS domain-containing (seleno)protein n=1 Tax=Aquimarina callyspongiae TaxID=3098150 RepID=UPI002AB5A29D|nr:YHS domain-containing (seleno)protein [Aquimarina sp. 2201CG5-10]MDY8136903.1 YHS domain-containing (seleno)protein [Aquimarina sp. 2201CG5-10]